MLSTSELISGADDPSKSGTHRVRWPWQKPWFPSQFEALRKGVPGFDYTKRSICDKSRRRLLESLLASFVRKFLNSGHKRRRKAKVHKEESVPLLAHSRMLAQLRDNVAPCEAQMENWNTNLAIMGSKEL
ncbi:hypothetical protein QQ045_012765 [Rhodiola kirilowii]